MDHRSLHAQPLFAIEFAVACGGDLLRRIARACSGCAVLRARRARIKAKQDLSSARCQPCGREFG